MIFLSKTPFRISFFGGGSDYPSWYKKYGGEVISTTIDKFNYIYLRKNSHYLNYKYKIVYSKVEYLNSLNKIKHRAVREILKFYKNNSSLEIHYDGDLPARSGVGSSSAFVVGLIKIMEAIKFKNIQIDNNLIAKKAIYLERNIMKEIVGSQDQVATAIGGFNIIKFHNSGNYETKKIKKNNYLDLLDKNLFLVFTNVQRVSHDIAKSFVNNLTSTKKKNIFNILKMVSEAKKIIEKRELDEFGLLLNQSWHEKKELSRRVSTLNLDYIYDKAIKNGAIGGKILGAGGGGFFLFYVPKKNQEMFLKNIKPLNVIPFNFEYNGSKLYTME